MQTFDAIVIGAGPAGTSAAAVLAERGRRVALLEREAFPRYKVGESLIPFCWYPLERLGLIEALDASAFVVRKYSVQFISVEGQRSTPFYFFDHTSHDCARTWQVVRSDFDRLLLQNAVSRGAELFARTSARELLRAGDRVVGVRAVGPEGAELDLRAPVTIDATGRDSFSQTRNGWRVADRRLRKMAIWTYWRGALRDEGHDEGATTIAYLPDKGWFWYIPLPDDVVSVGVVADGAYLYDGEKDSGVIFEREAARQPWIRERLAPGSRCGEYRVTSDFSYRARHCAENGLVLIGDAFAFLDPVFSSGVFFALSSGVMAADATDAALAAGDASAERFEDYGRRFCRAIEAMRRLVHAFYDPEFNFGTFLKAYPAFRSDLTDVLIGNLEGDLDPLFGAVSEFADIPGPLPHGLPRV
jgi:flavin-dependent dehydrogenase